jgi:transposase InsO family protein
MKADYPVRQLCETLGVAPSGFYDWHYRQSHPGARALEEVFLSLAIAQIHQDSRQTYGSPRIQQSLAQAGRAHGRNRIARLMRQQGLCGRAKRRFRVRTTDSRHDHPIAPNHLAQRPAPRKPNEIWVTDITYIATDQGWLYLAGIMDLFSRKIVGWALEPSLDSQLVLASWNRALNQRRPPAQLLVHSDRGCQYASEDFRLALAQAKAVPSMSRKANCYDNAAMESFWSTLKHELVYRSHFVTHAEAQTAVFDYIESFYNRRRLHSSLNYLSPVDFESKTN